MRRQSLVVLIVLSFSVALPAQNRRLWVLRPTGEAVEYDPFTFAEKQTVKPPAEASAAPEKLSVNALGQMLFAQPVDLPLAEGDLAGERKAWLWDGHRATSLAFGAARTTATAGSNLSISEAAPAPFLSADGAHLFWFSNQARRWQRDGVDLSTKTTWSAWRTDLAGANRENLVSVPLPDCPCPTGGCEDSCPYGEVWVPQGGVGKFFLLTQLIAGQTKPIYKSTSLYQENSGKWIATPVDPQLRNILDAANPNAILEAIPDTGCCGWTNESDDQTLLRLPEKTLTVYDERADYKNPDYDVSFFTRNGKLSPDLTSVAFTVAATAKPNTPIQLAQQGQASPEESSRIRKALADLPAVEIKSVKDNPRRIAFLPRAEFVGWIGEKEILILQDHWLIACNLETGARRRSTVHAEDAAHVFLL